jgi:hypothetical protein
VKRKLAAGLAAAATTIALLSGCAHHLSHGKITGKEYAAPYTWYMHSCMMYRKGYCIFYSTIPVDEPPHWTLTLKDGKQTGTTDVDQATWDRVKIGQRYP